MFEKYRRGEVIFCDGEWPDDAILDHSFASKFCIFSLMMAEYYYADFYNQKYDD